MDVDQLDDGALTPSRDRRAMENHPVAARLDGWFADFDAVQLVESAGEAVGDRLLIHYRLHLTRGGRRRVCTQTAVCTLLDERLQVIDLLCSGLQEEGSDEHVTAAPGAQRVG